MRGDQVKNGAEGGNRTPMGCPTRPSNVRVYQFHHFGIFSTAYVIRGRPTVTEGNHLGGCAAVLRREAYYFAADTLVSQLSCFFSRPYTQSK